MKIQTIALFLLLLAFTLTGFLESPYMRYVYSIEDGSRLTIEGTSNINSFGCLDKSYFPASPFTVAALGDTLRFSNAVLSLRTKNLDCDNSQINKDLYAAMKAEEYPFIKVALHGAAIQSGTFRDNGDWSEIKAVATLTITGVSKRVVMDVKARRVDANKFRIVASKELRMTDFNIQPPSAMLGLIKVNNNIVINFDLIAQIRPE